MLAGSLLSGGAVDYFTHHNAAGQIVRDWRSFWFSSSIMSVVILVMILITFRTHVKIRPKEEVPVEPIGV
jgi:hypothetical protein